MTVSMQRAVELLDEKRTKLTTHDFMFIVTVLRDNVEDDALHKTLDDILKKY